jgi:hypothetical protein
LIAYAAYLRNNGTRHPFVGLGNFTSLVEHLWTQTFDTKDHVNLAFLPFQYVARLPSSQYPEALRQIQVFVRLNFEVEIESQRHDTLARKSATEDGLIDYVVQLTSIEQQALYNDDTMKQLLLDGLKPHYQIIYSSLKSFVKPAHTYKQLFAEFYKFVENVSKTTAIQHNPRSPALQRPASSFLAATNPETRSSTSFKKPRHPQNQTFWKKDKYDFRRGGKDNQPTPASQVSTSRPTAIASVDKASSLPTKRTWPNKKKEL